MNLMFAWFFIHPLIKQSLLMSFATKCLVMGSNVIIWQLILVVLNYNLDANAWTLHTHYHCPNYDK